MQKYNVTIELDDQIKTILRAAGGPPTSQDEMILSRFLHVAGLADVEVEVSGGRMVCRYTATNILRSHMVSAKLKVSPKLN